MLLFAGYGYLCMNIVDLSHTVKSGVATYHGGMLPEFIARSTFETKGRVTSAIRMGIHTGTHLDAPLHFIPDGLAVAELPLDRTIGIATLVDVSDLPRQGRFVDTQAFLDATAGFPYGDIALIYTGFDQQYGNPSFSNEYPCLNLESIHQLIRWDIRALAIDTVSVDPMELPDFENHKALLGSGIPIVECVNNMQAIGQKRFLFAAVPLKLNGLEGSPCRAIAITDWEIS